jgi:hypothetical protein
VSAGIDPAGRLPVPETGVQVPPVSMLRNSPPLVLAAIRIAPRAATAAILRPMRVLAPSIAQLAPPSVVRYTPISSSPRCPKLLQRPVPAIKVWWLVSVGSKASAPIDCEGRSSVSGVQVGCAAVASVVRQMPPLTAPM